MLLSSNYSILIYYLLGVTVLTFLMFGIDKWKAKRSGWRVPERVLLCLAAIGGSVGALLGMWVWHHKTLHKKFKYGVPAILVVQIAIVVLVIYLSKRY